MIIRFKFVLSGNDQNLSNHESNAYSTVTQIFFFFSGVCRKFTEFVNKIIHTRN